MLTLAGFSIVLTAFMARGSPPLATVPHVDLNEYLGVWYEIAEIPQYFRSGCVADTTMEYEALPNDQIRVLNSCRTAGGTQSIAEGRAKVTDPESNSKLKTTFTHLGERYIYLFGGQYWVIDLDPNYLFAVVGHPSRKYGWILSRNPSLPTVTLKQIEDVLRSKDYDPCAFKITPQTGGLTEKTSLCQVVPP